MEAKRIEIAALFHAIHKKANIVKLANVILPTFKQIANRQRATRSSNIYHVLLSTDKIDLRALEL